MKINKRLIIGITGQIGAGKTQTAQILAGCLDAKLIELDSYIHSLYQDTKVKVFLQKNFGKTVFTPTGEVSRKELGKLVFSRPELLNTLNNFFDKYVYQKLELLFQKFPRHNFLIDGAIILQNSWKNLLDKVILVRASQQLKKKGHLSD